VDPRDRGFTLGDGLFETMRVVAGTVPWLRQHLARLQIGVAAIDLTIPWTGTELGQAVVQTVDANGLRDGAVRLTVSRGVPTQRGLLPESEPTPSLVIHAQPFSGYPAALYARGMRVITSGVVRNEHSPLAQVKTLSALDNVLARHEAATRGADEAIMRNSTGCLACASAANLFLVIGEMLVTPSAASGVILGTARQRVLSQLAPQFGLAVAERTVIPDELTAANEAFLTSSLLGVMPLTMVDGHSVGEGVPGPLTMAFGTAMVESWSNQPAGLSRERAGV